MSWSYKRPRVRVSGDNEFRDHPRATTGRLNLALGILIGQTSLDRRFQFQDRLAEFCKVARDFFFELLWFHVLPSKDWSPARMAR